MYGGVYYLKIAIIVFYVDFKKHFHTELNDIKKDIYYFCMFGFFRFVIF